jgi:hypothetical protein
VRTAASPAADAGCIVARMDDFKENVEEAEAALTEAVGALQQADGTSIEQAQAYATVAVARALLALASK